MYQLPLAVDFLDTLLLGRGTMIPLLGASVLLVALVLERLIMLRRGRVLPPRLTELIEKTHRSKESEELRQQAAQSDAPLALILRAGMDHGNDTRANAIEAMTITGKEQARSLERGLGLIDTIAVAAPLLGLLGTLLGMMKVFFGIYQHGSTGMAAVAPGVAEALITTVVGLIIAIPSLIFYNYFMRRIDGLVLALEKYASIFAATALPPVEGERSAQERSEWSFTEPRGGAR